MLLTWAPWASSRPRPGDWSLFLLVALGGTIAGYFAAMGAITVFDLLDSQWLRLSRPEEAGFVILLSGGPAVALLVAVLVLFYA